MEVKEIIENLRYNKDGKFQKESVLEAKKKIKEVTKELLKELEKVANNINSCVKEPDYILPLYAFYLLAEFKEKKAFPIIVKIITYKNQDEVDYLLGDLITGDLRKILASTYNGDIDSLYSIITNIELNEYIRSAAFKSLEILQKYNIISKDKVINIIENMLENELKEDDSIVISDIVVYIAENKLYNKIELVKKLYKEYRIDEQMIGEYEEFVDGIYGDKEPLEEKNMIEDTIKSLSWWACFDQDNDKKEFNFEDFAKKLIEYENKEIERAKEIGRNDLCSCGSGKKYKKCCMNKKEIQVVTPADLYIKKSLKDYPKETLKLYYDAESVEIDEKLYQVLKHKAIPLWIDRNYTEELRRNTKNMEEAIELIKEKCKKEKINTVKEFDEKIAIHFNLNEVINKYFNILDNTRNVGIEEIQDKKVDFLIQMIQIFEIEKEYKKTYINNIIERYLEEGYYLEAEEKINMFSLKIADMKKYLNIKLSEVYLAEGKELEKTIEPIEEYIEQFGLDEELEIRKIEIYYEYALLNYYEDEKQEIEIYQKLWKLVKDFIKNQNITLEEEYNKKHEEEYYFSNILYRIEQFYQNNCITYLEQRIEFLNEAMHLINIEEESREILINGLVETYCDLNKETEAIRLIDEFMMEFPNDSNAILTKANIFTEKENPDYKKAINIIEEKLKNDEIDNKYRLFVHLALLYDEYGDEEKAKEYQVLARQNEEDDLPF